MPTIDDAVWRLKSKPPLASAAVMKSTRSGADSVEREPLPHLGEEERRQPARMAEEARDRSLTAQEMRRRLVVRQRSGVRIARTRLVRRRRHCGVLTLVSTAMHRQVATIGRLGTAGRLLDAPLYTGRRLFDARRPVARRLFLERRNDLRRTLHPSPDAGNADETRSPTADLPATARRPRASTRDFLTVGSAHGHRRQQRLRVRHQRLAVQIARRSPARRSCPGTSPRRDRRCARRPTGRAR